MSNINFFYEEVDFTLDHQSLLIPWIEGIITRESHKEVSSINYIFCSDKFLHKINMEYLGHNTFTDIITFDNSEQEQDIDADIYISIERVQENSREYEVPLENELHRVMIHGILHLIGYKDSSNDEKQIIRKKENECLNLLKIQGST